MMKNKKIIASLLAATLVVSSICVSSGIDAAKKVKLSAKKKAITVDQSFNLTVKNKAKKAKVTWKVSDKKVLAITAKKVKAKKATATIKGLAEGKAKVTAKYKLGKKVKKLNCTVTVSAATPVASVAPTTAATVAPSKAPATKAPAATATVKPTRTPRPTAKPPTPTPKLTNPNKINLATAQLSGENGGTVSYTNGVITSTMSSLTGFIIPSGITSNANKYTHVEIVYELEGGDVNLYIADNRGQGAGEDAAGWSPEIKLNQYGTGKEVKLTVGAAQYNSGGDGSIRAIKIFNFGSTTTIRIKSITYYMSE